MIRPSSGRGIGLVRGFYATAGAIAVAFGAMGLLGILSAANHGCRLVYSQADFSSGPNAMPSGGCEQFVDVLGIAAPLMIGLVLVLAAVRYDRADRTSTLTKAVAIPGGVVAGAMPLIAYWQLHSYYRLAFGPVELAFFALGFAILVLGLFAAFRTADLIRRPPAVSRST
ncbi:MAG: hypothetical protein ACR2H3_02270 [Acidimicrobiales bacterium]